MDPQAFGAQPFAHMDRTCKHATLLGAGRHAIRAPFLVAGHSQGGPTCCRQANAQEQLNQSERVEISTSKHDCLASKLPNEVLLLVLAWSGLRTSTAAAACSSAFRALHRAVAATPELLARALLAEYGPSGAASYLYGTQARHAVNDDEGIAAAIQEMLLLSAPSGAAVAAFAEAMSSSAAAMAVAEDADAAQSDPTAAIPSPQSDPSTTPLGTSPKPLSCPNNTFLAPPTCRTTPTHIRSAAAAAAGGGGGFSPAGASWNSGASALVSQQAGVLLRAAAAAGHVRVAAAAMGLGARMLEGALVGAAACGRRQVVRMLLASGANPDAAEPFGPCALFEAARNGHTESVQLLLDAGAAVDGAADPDLYDDKPAAATPLGRRQAFSPGGAGWGDASSTWTNHSEVAAGGSVGAGAGLAPLSPALDASILAAVAAAADPPPSPAAGGGLFEAGSDGRARGLWRKRRRSSDLGEPRTPSDDSAAAAAAVAAVVGDGAEGEAPGGHAGGGGGEGEPVPHIPARRRCTEKIAPWLPPPLPRRRIRPLPAMLPPLPLPLLPPLAVSLPVLLPPPTLLLWPARQRRTTPLLAACKGGHAGPVTLLLRRGARLDLACGSELVLAGHPDVVDELLAAVPSLAVHLGSALVSAAGANRVAVVSALLRHGTEPACNSGMALNEAAYQGHCAVMELLLAAGGARLRGSAVLTAALNLARRWGREEVSQLLEAAM